MQKKYTWKELMADGLLIDPSSVYCFNGEFGLGMYDRNMYDSELDAEKAFTEYQEECECHFGTKDKTKFVLLTIYQEEAE